METHTLFKKKFKKQKKTIVITSLLSDAEVAFWSYTEANFSWINSQNMMNEIKLFGIIWKFVANLQKVDLLL